MISGEAFVKFNEDLVKLQQQLLSSRWSWEKQKISACSLKLNPKMLALWNWILSNCSYFCSRKTYFDISRILLEIKSQRTISELMKIVLWEKHNLPLKFFSIQNWYLIFFWKVYFKAKCEQYHDINGEKAHFSTLAKL